MRRSRVTIPVFPFLLHHPAHVFHSNRLNHKSSTASRNMDCRVDNVSGISSAKSDTIFSGICATASSHGIALGEVFENESETDIMDWLPTSCLARKYLLSPLTSSNWPRSLASLQEVWISWAEENSSSSLNEDDMELYQAAGSLWDLSTQTHCSSEQRKASSRIIFALMEEMDVDSWNQLDWSSHGKILHTKLPKTLDASSGY